MFFRYAILLVLLLAIPACVEIRTLSPEEDYGRVLKVGEQIVVVESDGTRIEMLIGKITQTHLIGSYDIPPFERIEIPLADITGIEAERVNVGKSAAAALAGVILVPPFIALQALSQSCIGDC